MRFHLERKPLRALALSHREAYQAARPHPHAVIDGLLGGAAALALAAAFPRPSHPGWKRRDHKEQAGRLGQLQRDDFEGVDPALRLFLTELSQMAFLDFLEALTGEKGLIPDPHFRGAGLHLTLPGGHLALHADFNRDRFRGLRRRLTALYYLNPAWEPSWGGELELWRQDRSTCEVRIAPLLDRLVVMAHGDDHWHGHPAPLRCPADRARAAVAAYFYSADPAPTAEPPHGAIWLEI